MSQGVGIDCHRQKSSGREKCSKPSIFFLGSMPFIGPVYFWRSITRSFVHQTNRPAKAQRPKTFEPRVERVPHRLQQLTTAFYTTSISKVGFPCVVSLERLSRTSKQPIYHL